MSPDSFHGRLAAAATPGPWRVEEASVWGADFRWVAESMDGNAALIAACPPEMVQAWENGMDALGRIIADLETNTERGAPDYAHKANVDYHAQVAALQEDNDE